MSYFFSAFRVYKKLIYISKAQNYADFEAVKNISWRPFNIGMLHVQILMRILSTDCCRRDGRGFVGPKKSTIVGFLVFNPLWVQSSQFLSGDIYCQFNLTAENRQ
jgi:hypothetical protein